MNRHICPELRKLQAMAAAEGGSRGMPPEENTIEFLVCHYNEHKNKKKIIELLPKVLEKYRNRSIFK